MGSKNNGYFRNMEKYLVAPKTYRYVTSGAEHAAQVLLALHGYGQLAKYFIRKFHFLEDTYHLLAPEGPHRFYLSGSNGRVGASWMTKEARELDIEDNLRWLNIFLEQKIQEQPAAKRTLLGFSQGAATAARWYQKNPECFDQLILWAGVFPPDIDAGTFPTTKPLHFVLGDEDEFYHGAEAEGIKKRYATLGFQVHTYPGKHDLDAAVLKRILG